MLQGNSIYSVNMLASGLFPLPLVLISVLCPYLLMFFKSSVFVRGAFDVIY